MAKLSQQLKEEEAKKQGSPRVTRKQRVAQKQAVQRQILEQKRQEALRKRAEEYQKEHFKDKVVDETYTYQTPDWDKISKNHHISTSQYNYSRKSESGRQALDRWFAKHGYMKTVTATRKRTIPFTIDDSEHDYGDVYDQMPDDLKQFFPTHEVVKQQKADRIVETKKKVADKMAYADQKIAERKEYYANKIKKREDWWHSKSSSYRNKGDRKQDHKDRINEYEDELDEDIAKWQGYKKGLSKASSGLNSNQDIKFQNIENYAWDVADYEESKEEARNENRSNFYKQAREGKLDETFKKLGLDPNKPSYYGFKKKVDAYNKDVAYKQNLVKWAERVGFDKISPQAQKTLNPDLVKWQKDNPNEKLIFKGLDPIGVESGALQQSISIDNYKKVTSPDYVYAEWQKKNPPRKTPQEIFGVSDKVVTPFGTFETPKKQDPQFKILTAGKELPIGYGSQGTAQVNSMGDFVAPTQIMDFKEYEKIQNTPSTPVKDLWGGIKKGYGWANERVHWDFNIGGSPSMPKLNVISFGLKDDQTAPEKFFGKGTAGIEKGKQSVEEWVLGKDNIENLDKRLETKYQGEYQYSFEQKYMKDLIYNETDFETASEEFKKSDEAKKIQERYQKEYGTEYKDLQTLTIKDDGFVKTFKGDVLGGVAQFGLGIGDLGVKAVSTPLNLATTGVGVYTGVKALSVIPVGVQAVGLGALGTYGAYKFLDPSSTYIEAGSGLVTAGLSFGTLGYMGYRYLKSPVVQRVAIKPPKATLKSTSTIGKDVKIIKDGVTSNKVLYGSQKLSQTGVKGYRTVVTTKGRVLSNKFWRHIGVPKKFTTIDSNAIYRGIPTQQLGKSYTIKSLRGNYRVVTTKSGYQKAFDLMRKYYPKTVSDASIKAQLRYTAPRVYETYLNKGVITIKGDKAIGYFEHLYKRPVLNVDAKLGIKTRGATTIKDITKVQRQLVKLKSGETYAKYQSFRGSGSINKQGLWKDWKEVEFLTGKTKVFSTKTQKGFEYLGKQSGVDVYKTDALYKDMFSISKKDALKIKISKFRNNIKADISYKPYKVELETSQQRLYSKIIDLDKGKNVWVKPTNIKKTPFSKTFGLDQTDDAVVTFTKTKPTNVVKKIMDKIDDVGGSTSSPALKEQSKYWGTGQYEQSVGGLSPQEILQHQNILKAPVSPSLRIAGIKNSILIKQSTLSLSKIGVASAVGSQMKLKQAPELKADLKVDNNLKNLIKTDVGIKSDVKSDVALKTSPALKTQLKSIIDLSSPLPQLTTPTFRPPSIPKITPPPKIPIPIWLKAKRSQRSGTGTGKGFGEVAYLPDFTSRALGLDPETLTQKQAQKKLKKLLTGLEIRRGVKVKY